MALNSDDDSAVEAQIGELNAQLEARANLEGEVADLRAKLDAANVELSGFRSRVDDLNAQFETKAALEAEVNTLRERVAGLPAFRWVKGKDDLTKIRGIGNVIEKRLNEAGIISYPDVAASTPEHLTEVAGAQSWQKVTPQEWIEQAKKMKSVGQIMVLEDGTTVGTTGDQLRQELNSLISENADLRAKLSERPRPQRQRPDKKLKKQLDSMRVEVERLRGSATPRGRDRLQEIDGIDHALEEQLYAAGIDTYHELAELSPARLAEIIGVEMGDDPGSDYAAWIRQANQILANERRGRNRLQQITGIGPNFESKLFEADIHTYYDVANSTEEELRAAIEADGVVSGVNYGDWIKKAISIVGGTFITGAGGKIGAGGHAVDIKVSTSQRDRLPDINGVGAVFARRLNAAGIYTFAQVAETDPGRLREIVKAREWQHVNTEDWIEQARGFIS